jgi:Zn-dependent hydrolases, including glyoxylases
MEIKIFPGFSNTYLVFWENEGIIIDPGNPLSHLKEEVKSLKIKSILITHGHFDHYIYLEEYRREFNCPVYMNFKDKFLVEDTSWIIEKFGIRVDYVPKIDGELREGDEFVLGSKSLKIIEIPGHSPGSVGIVGENFVIVGDLMFKWGGIGRTDLPGGDEKALMDSIRRVLEFPEEFWVYPGHGDFFKIKEAKKWIGLSSY